MPRTFLSSFAFASRPRLAHSVSALKNSQLKLSPAFWLFVLTLAVRLCVLVRLSHSPYFLPEAGDMKFYHDWALRILHGKWNDAHAFYGLPGYAYFLTAIYKCVGVDPFAVGSLQAIAEAFTSVLIWKIASNVFSKSETHDGSSASLIGIIAAIGWALFQPAQTFSIILMPTSWMILAFWYCVWRILVIKKASLWRFCLELGLIIGLVANVIATILFLIPLVIAAMFTTFGTETSLGRRAGNIVCSSIVLIAAVFIGTAPCWYHNYFVAHEPVLLSAHSGINFYIGNNPIANGYPKIPPGMRAGQEGMLKDSITMAELAMGHPLKRVEVSHYWSAKASDYIHQHLRDWLILMLLKFKNFWNAYQYDDLSLVTLFAKSDILVPGLRFGLVAAFGLAGMLLAIMQVPRSRWVAGAILLHMAALLPVFVTERYRMAAVPGLLIMMGYALCQLWRALLDERWRMAFVNLSLSAATTSFVSWPQSDPGLWALDFYNTGIKETDAGHLAQARKDIALALEYVPDNSEINFAMGNLCLKEGSRTKAKQFYRRAIEINPRHSSAYNNLGVLAMQENFWDAAISFFQSSLQIEPDDAKTNYLLAKSLLGKGDRAAARDALNKALALQPNQKEFLELRSTLEP